MACALALSLLLAACGDDDEASTSDETTESTDGATDETTGGDEPEESVLGEPNEATGEPVLIGMITDGGGNSPITAQAEDSVAGSEIAVQYANEYLGGIAGRPIELVVCESEATPAGAQDCANEMVTEGVAAVVNPFTGQGASIVPGLVEAGIPYVGLSGSSAEELTTPGAFAMTGGFPVILASFAAHAKEEGFAKLAMLVIDVPAATEAANAIGGIVFGNAGVEYETIAAPPGTPDLTPQIQSAVSGGAEAIAITGDITFCTSAMQAYETLGLDLPRYVIPTCVDQSSIEQHGSFIEGAFVATTTGADEEDPDQALYAELVSTYGEGDIDPDPTQSSTIAAGVISMLSFVNAMEGFTGTPDAAGILGHVPTVTDFPVFLGGGITATCDGSAVSIMPNVCSADVLVGEMDGEGTPMDPQLLETADLFKM